MVQIYVQLSKEDFRIIFFLNEKRLVIPDLQSHLNGTENAK